MSRVGSNLAGSGTRRAFPEYLSYLPDSLRCGAGAVSASNGHRRELKYARELYRCNHSEVTNEVSCFQRRNNNCEYAGLDIL